jgi:ACS family hexuronate transporter-like MFS transporter
VAALLSLITLAVPFASTTALACGAVSMSLAAVAAFSVNMYTLPLDAFGASRAAFSISLLVSSYGILTFFISPIFGRVIDHSGYNPLITLIAFTPLAACAILWATRSVD